MKPLHFGEPARRLFGMHHAPDPARANGFAILMCNPFGHEAIRVHRLYRVLTDRLVRNGCHVLRFDYFGTGDSMGDDEDGDLAGWQRDILTAHQTLLELSGGAAVTWFGARLGATLAVGAAQASSMPLHRLMLWDPIVDGSAYSQLLRVKHVEALELSYCIPDVAWRRSLATDASAFQDEAIGFATPPLMRSQLQALRLPVDPLPQVRATLVMAESDDAPVDDWIRRSAASGQAIQLSVLDHGMVWTSDPQPDMAMVPAGALVHLARELGAGA